MLEIRPRSFGWWWSGLPLVTAAVFLPLLGTPMIVSLAAIVVAGLSWLRCLPWLHPRGARRVTFARAQTPAEWELSIAGSAPQPATLIAGWHAFSRMAMLEWQLAGGQRAVAFIGRRDLDAGEWRRLGSLLRLHR